MEKLDGSLAECFNETTVEGLALCQIRQFRLLLKSSKLCERLLGLGIGFSAMGRSPEGKEKLFEKGSAALSRANLLHQMNGMSSALKQSAMTCVARGTSLLERNGWRS